MIETAYSRPATEDEINRCLEFIAASDSSGQQSWIDLAHVLINSKEFSYLK